MVLLGAGRGNEATEPGADTESAIAPFSAKINFQLAGAPVPAGYEADTGGV